ncbi:hypothetical protein TNIN_107651 [Trichonephila inaurata madagascariensis]|uniref:Uncharacterized protein n=1 Tax=Trichonephila inaurata madagascariensis TaxID=2747483 RepID=A0A8X6Y600_9ARAC|nr:hypothetical protein TNIN_107651 [Trichonephila inaurata madagascariensis]
MCFVTHLSVLYKVTVKGDPSNVHLVCSRNRPIRTITLPRLELLADLMGLLPYQTNIRPSNITLWSDSWVVLAVILTNRRHLSAIESLKFYSTLPQHSCDIAEEIRIQQTIFHKAFFQLGLWRHITKTMFALRRRIKTTQLLM